MVRPSERSYDETTVGSGRRSKEKTFWIVIGGVIAIPILFWVWMSLALGGFDDTNQAEKTVQPFLNGIRAAGGVEICKNGDSGKGFDNTEPWYQGYYELQDGPTLTGKVKAEAERLGYRLSEDVKRTNDHKDTARIASESFDGSAYDQQTEYLIGSKNGSQLTVKISRSTTVKLRCAHDRYGEMKTIGSGKVLLDIDFTLPGN